MSTGCRGERLPFVGKQIGSFLSAYCRRVSRAGYVSPARIGAVCVESEDLRPIAWSRRPRATDEVLAFEIGGQTPAQNRGNHRDGSTGDGGFLCRLSGDALAGVV